MFPWARMGTATLGRAEKHFSILTGINKLMWGENGCPYPGGTSLGGQGLPSPKEDQASNIVRLPNFFSDSDIKAVLNAAVSIRQDGAGSVKLSSNDPMEDRGEWQTTYLHTHLMFQSRLPDVHARLAAAALAADKSHWGIADGALSVSEPGTAVATRCIELHHVGPLGGLPHHLHYDSGSCVTIDVMLSEPKSGGEFETFEVYHDDDDDDDVLEVTVPADGESASSRVERGKAVAHDFRRGDAIVFPSHKWHSVRPVARGSRQVLIMELWVGEERRCSHRCEQHFGRCDYHRGGWHAATGSSVAW